MPIIRDLLATGEKRGRMPRLHGTSTAAGVSVDAERSLQVSAVYACVSLIAEAIGTMPVHMYRKTAKGRQPVLDHPLLRLLTAYPNDDIDSGEFLRAMVGWMLIRGNGLTYREIGGDGRDKGLWPIAPTSISPARTARGRLAYDVTLSPAEFVPGFTPGTKKTVAGDRMLHFRAFALGAWGLSPVGLARTKIGTAFAAEEYGAGFFARGAHPGGTLNTEKELSDEQFERLEQQWNEMHGGFGKSHSPAILEGGLTWETVGLPPAEAMFLETQKYTANTIAGHIYRVPPFLIGDVERSSSWGTGIAEQGISFVRYTLMPWIVRIERVLNRLLIEPDLYIKLNPAALERGDISSRYAAYAVGKQWGFLNTNEIKAHEDEAPIGPAGDVYMQPLNMVPVDSFDDPERAPSDPGRRGVRAASIRDRHVTAHRRALRHYFDDQATTVLAEYDVERSTTLREIDRDKMDAKLARLLARLGLASVIEAASEVTERFDVELDDGGFDGWTRKTGRNVARHINDATFASVAAAVDEDELRDVFGKLIRVQAAQIATTRVAESFGFGRQEGAKQSGARKKTWRVTSGNPRASHAAMDGETVDVGDTFSNGARWPGDTSNLDADESAGCQCDMDVSP